MTSKTPSLRYKIYAIFLLLLICISCSTSPNNKKHISLSASPSPTEKWLSNFNNQYQDSAFHKKESILLQRISKLKKEDDKKNVAEYYNILGSIYLHENHYEQAIKSYKSALTTEDEISRIKSLNNIGVCDRRLDKLRTAATAHLEALKAIENYNGEYADISYQHRVSLNSIGNVYLSLGQYNKALEYFNQSLALEIEAENHLGMAINYNNIGSTYQFLGNYNKAKENYLQALQENSNINSKLGKSISYNSIGELYFMKGKYRMAMVEFDSALVYSSQITDNYHQSITYINLSKAYLQLEKYDEAFQQLEALKVLAKTTNSRSIYQSLYSQLSLYYEQQNNAKLALTYHRKAVIYNDSIINTSNSNYINDILSVYDTEKKEQQIELLSAKNQISSQRQKLGLSIIILLILALALLYYIEKERKKKQILNMGILQQQLLRSQMNPHFLFNALGSIQNYMLKNDSKKAAGFLNNFASLTRSILEHSSKKKILLSDEIEMLHNYIKLEQMRLGNSFEYSIKLEDDLESDFIYIPPMLIQPFVENAVKHGLKNINYPGELIISLSEDDDILNIQVKDNGIGLNQAKRNSSTHRSMSMQIFEKRRQALWTTEKKQVLFSIEDCKEKGYADKGTLVNIKFPIE